MRSKIIAWLLVLSLTLTGVLFWGTSVAEAASDLPKSFFDNVLIVDSDGVYTLCVSENYYVMAINDEESWNICAHQWLSDEVETEDGIINTDEHLLTLGSGYKEQNKLCPDVRDVKSVKDAEAFVKKHKDEPWIMPYLEPGIEYDVHQGVSLKDKPSKRDYIVFFDKNGKYVGKATYYDMVEHKLTADTLDTKCNIQVYADKINNGEGANLWFKYDLCDNAVLSDVYVVSEATDNAVMDGFIDEDGYGKNKGTSKKVETDIGGVYKFKFTVTVGLSDFYLVRYLDVDWLTNNTNSDDAVDIPDDLFKDNAPPKVKFSKVKNGIATGTRAPVVMTVDKKSHLTFNGDTKEGYNSKGKFVITSNGDYAYTAVAKNGMVTRGIFKVRGFKDPSAADNPGIVTQQDVDTLAQSGSSDVLAWRVLICATILFVAGVGFALCARIPKGDDDTNG